jgi:hypothetical protein
MFLLPYRPLRLSFLDAAKIGCGLGDGLRVSGMWTSAGLAKPQKELEMDVSSREVVLIQEEVCSKVALDGDVFGCQDSRSLVLGS